MLARKRNMMSLVGLLTVCLTGVIVKLQRSHRLSHAKLMLEDVKSKVEAAKEEYNKNRWTPELLADRSVSSIPTPPDPPGTPKVSESSKLRSKAEFLPAVLRNLDIPEDKKSDELKVRTWEYLKVREYWKKKIEEGVVGPKSKMHPEPVFVPAPPLDKKLPKLIPHECRPASATCDEIGDAARFGSWQQNSAICNSPDRWTKALCSIKGETWIPSNANQCGQICGYSPAQACAILSRSNRIAVLGDSLMRQVYEALTCLTSGDYKYGALKMGLIQRAYDNCAGDHQFNERACLGGIEFNSLNMPGPPCGGKVGIEFRGAGTSTEVFQVIKTLDELNKTDLVILGVGLWDKMVVSEYQEKFFKPLLAYLADPKNQKDLPQLLFLPPHAMQLDFGYKGCTAENVIKYYNAIATELQKHGVVVLDSINLTIDAETESYDGMHYIGSVNYVKTSLILRWLETGYLKQQQALGRRSA